MIKYFGILAKALFGLADQQQPESYLKYLEVCDYR